MSTIDTPVHGSIHLELQVTGTVALSRITDGWKPEERAALLAGDEEARDELISQASQIVMAQPDDVSEDVVQISTSAGAVQ